MAHADTKKVSRDFSATNASSNVTSATQVRAGTSNQVMRITDIVLSTDTQTNIQIQDSDDTALIENLYMAANTIWSKTFKTPIEVPSGKDLEYVAGDAGNVNITVSGYDETA